MTEQEIAAYKEQMFGTEQSPTQTQSQTEQSASAEKTETATTEEKSAAATTTEQSQVAATTEEAKEEIVDANEYLEKELGFKDWESAKTAIAELRQKVETPAEIKFANQQSELIVKALMEGKTDEVYEFLSTQKRLSEVDNLSADDALKLHIKESNKHYKKEDVADVFEEKYSYPDKPIKDELEEDTDYNTRVSKWEEFKAKIDRRKERDAVTAKTELSKLKTELVFPEISKPTTDADYEQYKASLAQQPQKDAETKEAYSKISPKDVAMVFKFNDEASKLAFDINYEPDKESFDKSVSLASDLNSFLSNYYGKDGSPDRTRFLKDLYAGQNVEKIVTEAVKVATNETKAWFLKNQKNIGDGTQRNYTMPQQTDIDKLREQVFGKAV